MAILVTGGAGYIGSHTCVELLAAGHDVVVLDNLANSTAESLARVQRITGRAATFVHGDIRDAGALDAVFSRHAVTAVIHFAGLKAVGESMAHPLRYFDNNVSGTVSLLQAMERAGVKNLVFSSSATVYGEPDVLPIVETSRLSVASPYGRSKLMVEDLCRDVAASDPAWHIILLRYFNPVGAHESGLMGEDPKGTPNNLMPYVMQVAVGRRAKLSVFGADYPTPDGTCLRDYIHVVDLAAGHVAALAHMDKLAGCQAINLGTGRPYSVLDLVAAAGRAVGKAIPYELVARRAGDVTACFANPAKARELLGWAAQRDLDAMCRDAWRWQSQNPNGYAAA